MSRQMIYQIKMEIMPIIDEERNDLTRPVFNLMPSNIESMIMDMDMDQKC